MEPSKYQLSDHAFICVAHRFCVVLDVRRDRYFAIRTDQLQLISQWLDGWISTNPDLEFRSPSATSAMIERLFSLGILVAARTGGRRVRPQLIEPASQYAGLTCAEGGLRSLRYGYDFVLAVRETRKRFATMTFEFMIGTLRGRRARGHEAAKVDLASEMSLVSIFNRWRQIYSRPRVCLFDSVCLLNFLGRFGFYPSLVFGVIPEPFRAHCWLQQGDIVINDAIERVETYTPILSV